MMSRHDAVLDFIKRRFQQDCNWLCGNCYYFAIILKDRFPDLQIAYITDVGHFIAIDTTNWLYYDYLGAHSYTEYDSISLLEDIKNADPIWYERIVRDCIL